MFLIISDSEIAVLQDSWGSLVRMHGTWPRPYAAYPKMVCATRSPEGNCIGGTNSFTKELYRSTPISMCGIWCSPLMRVLVRKILLLSMNLVSFSVSITEGKPAVIVGFVFTANSSSRPCAVWMRIATWCDENVSEMPLIPERVHFSDRSTGKLRNSADFSLIKPTCAPVSKKKSAL